MILDFGCGPTFRHRELYTNAGLLPVGADIHRNEDAGVIPAHEAIAIADVIGFDIVVASNVLNIQESLTEFLDTAHLIRMAAGHGLKEALPFKFKKPCPVILNYPSSPRRLRLSNRRFEEILEGKVFETALLPIRPNVYIIYPKED